jgi:HD domain
MSDNLLLLISVWLAFNLLLVPALGMRIAKRRAADAPPLPRNPDLVAAEAYVSILLTRLMVQACRVLDVEQTCLLVGDADDDGRAVLAAAHGIGEEAIGRLIPLDEALRASFGEVGLGVILPELDGRARTSVRAGTPSGRRVVLCAAGPARGDPHPSDRRELLAHVARVCAAAVEDVGVAGGHVPAARSCAAALAGAADTEASRVGRRLGLDPGALIELRLGASVLKVGRGDAVELAAVLESVPGLEAVALVLGLVDERWDGRGRPYGLRGERIPLASRILAACSALDRLSQQPRLGAGTPTDTALRQIQAESGAAFDPTVVTALSLEVMGEASLVPDPGWAADWARADAPYSLAA